MTVNSAPIPGVSTFTPTQLNSLRNLRIRYQQDQGLFSGQELERLRFLRWLYQTARVTA